MKRLALVLVLGGCSDPPPNVNVPSRTESLVASDLMEGISYTKDVRTKPPTCFAVSYGLGGPVMATVNCEAIPEKLFVCTRRWAPGETPEPTEKRPESLLNPFGSR